MAEIQSEERLGKSLGFFATFTIGTGTMIGAGIFVLPGIASATAGPAAIFAFLLGGLISIATALSMSELATLMPKAGGAYYFISRTMGPLFGTIIGLGAWFALIFKGSFALVGMGEYLEVLLATPVLITAVVAGLLLLILNYRGAESSSKLQNLIVIGLFVILSLFIGRGFFMLEVDNLTPVMPYGVSSVFATTGLIFVSYLGITELAAVAEEVKNPSKNLPRAFLASVGVVTFLYVGVMLIVNGVIPLEKLVDMNVPLVDTAGLMAGSGGRLAIILAGFFATVSTANAAIFSSSRFPFAMSRDNLMPKPIIAIHSKFKTPYRAVLLTCLLMIGLLFFFDVQGLAELASAFNVLIFILVNLAVVFLRTVDTEDYKSSFKDPLYPISQLIGIFGSFILLFQLGILPIIFAIGVVVLGGVWYKVSDTKEVEVEYDIIDALEKDVLRKEEVPDSPIGKKKRVLVPVSNPYHENDLLHLADHLGDQVIGLNVVKVPTQTSPYAARNDFEINPGHIHKLLREQFEEVVEKLNTTGKYIVSFDHNIPNSILQQAEEEKADLIIMGWQRANRLHYTIGSLASKVFSSAKNHVAILKGEFPEIIEKITVAYDGGDNSTYGLYLAKRLALDAGAQLSILRVVDPDLSAVEKREIRDELKNIVKVEKGYDIDYQIKERFSVSDTILEATQESDLTIVGVSNRRFSNALLGTTSQRVARHSKAPVLLVKRYKPLSSEGLRSFLDKFKNNKEEKLPIKNEN
ncbi:amino acid permease [Fuchsiella alkaliacetigena]|uniref:amino acid permease n=1 Tax=Fuchsiella alkaliacetigena TaxID=957042 RepID=UPI00200A49C9|nr:amino acid permease [Fuchsiella alkaliacetigena]MCK8823716.1 amino acid permease [Fuchsiella alkaliacetigena]